ncbi:MAG: CheR family methyltransferase [Lautropia sp.]
MTADVLTEAETIRLSECIRGAVGLDFPVERHRDLARGLERAASELGIRKRDLYAEVIASVSGSKPLRALTRQLTVGETFLYREAETLNVLSFAVLRELIERRRPHRRLRLWSAACCTGEEAYSLAIMIHRLLPDIAEWDIRILGTDINERFLERAERGRYGNWSFRSAPPWLLPGYFTPVDGGLHAPVAAVRRLVSFAPLNLADPADAGWPSDESVDVVLCRNVLMYFSPGIVPQVIARVRRTMAADGYLAVGLCEAQTVQQTGMAPIVVDGVTLFRPAVRRSAATAASVAAPAARPSRPRLARALRGEPAADAPKRRPPRAAACASDRLAQARVLADRGERAGALAIIDEVLARNPANVSACYLKALILVEAGNGDAARTALRQALYIDDTLVMAHIGLGTLDGQAGHRTRAAGHYGRAARLLAATPPEATVPESGGLTAAQVAASLASIISERVRR